MGYKLEISKAAQADLAKLDKPVLEAVRNRLSKLVENADQVKHLPLGGRLAGLYKLRVYDKYRVIYDWQREHQRIIVVRVGKRDEIYKE
jgi:addiction module RelE/StbE family toxin